METRKLSHHENDRRRAIVDRLRRLVGEGSAAFYFDACQLMATEARPESTSHLVAHLLTEVESSIRDVLEPSFAASAAPTKSVSGDENHRLEILRALEFLGIAEDHPAARTWLAIPGKANAYGFAARKHRDNLAPPRPVDRGFIEFFNRVEILFAVLLDRLEAKYLGIAEILDRFHHVQKPSTKDASEFLKRVPHSFVAQSAFFSRLANPRWLAPLEAAGAFRRPPAATVREENGLRLVSLPAWPTGDYLERVAAAPEVHGTVRQILIEAVECDNPRVHYHLAGAALALPPADVAEWAETERAWVEAHGVGGLPLLAHRLAELVTGLARAGLRDPAFGLFESLLRLHPPAETGESIENELISILRAQPRSCLDIWDYSRVLDSTSSALLAADGPRLLTILCDLLERAILISGGGDTSYIWRRAVEEDDEVHHDMVANALVTSLRRCAERVVASGSMGLGTVLALLESRTVVPGILSRLCLHLLRVNRDRAGTAVAERLTDESLFHEISVRHEYDLLLRDAYPHLDAASQAGWLALVDRGPLRAGVQGDPDDRAKGLWQEWTRDRLVPVSDSLPPDRRSQYEELVRICGEASSPGFPFAIYPAAFLGDESPKTLEEARAMSPEELLRFLREWAPEERGFLGPTPDGLGRQLSTLVGEDPGRFAAALDDFVGLDPTYVRSLLEGFRGAAERQASIPWVAVARFCRQVAEKSATARSSDASPLRGRDPDWSWTRSAVQRLLDTSLADDRSALPMALRDDLWRAVRALTVDSDPTPERDAEFASLPGHDPAFSLRSSALRTVVKYCAWVRRQLGDGWRGLESTPEAADDLDAHLDPLTEPALSVRAVYGEMLGHLVLLDRDWVRSRLDRLFPTELGSERRRLAVWNAYLRGGGPVQGAIELLRGEYASAVDALADASGTAAPPSRPEQALAEHLMILYGRGEIGLEPGGIVATFFSKASDRLRAHAIASVGRWFPEPADGERQQEALRRFRDLWDWRLQSTSDADRTEELLSFCWWFASPAFDGSWTSERLLTAYARAGTAPAEYCVLVRLAEIAPQYPLRAAEILAALAAGPGDGLQFSASRTEVRAALEPALTGADTAAQRHAIEAINRLAAKGASEFRSLLRGQR